MIVFNSSLPRSGSTLLQNLLAQNLANHCTPTSDLIELAVQVRNTYGTLEAFKSQGVMGIAPRITTAIKGLLEGFYHNELVAGKTVFDKSRGWLSYIELIEEVLDRPIRIVCCVRDIRDIVASFERIHRTNQITKADPQGAAYFDVQTVEGRVAQIMAPDAVVGLAVRRLRDVFDRGLESRLVIVRYSDLVADPVSEIVRISSAVGAEPFICKPAEVKQFTKEDDSAYGMKLHAIRPVVSDVGSTRWRDYLPEHVGQELHSQYPFIQQLAGATE